MIIAMANLKIKTPNEVIELTSKYNVLFLKDSLVNIFNLDLKDLEESPYSIISNEKEYPVLDTIRIKVNISKIGYVFAIYNKEDFNKALKDELLVKLTHLKDMIVTDPESRKEKVSSILNVVGEFKPLLVYVCAQTYFEDAAPATREYSLNDVSFPLIISEKPKEVVTKKEKKVKEESHKEKAPFSFKNLFDRFVINLRNEAISYIFNLLYTFLLAAVTLFMFVFFAKNSAGYAAVFIVFMGVFTAVLVGNLRLFMRKKSFRNLRKNLASHIVMNAIIFLGFGLGIMTSYLVTENLLKSETLVINYSTYIPASIFIALGLYIVALFVTVILELARENKALKNPQKNADSEENE